MLIYCPECGHEVSDKAPSCPYCGFPVQKERQDGIVKIKLPSAGKLGMNAMIATSKARAVWIIDKSRKELWRGELGQVASFSIDEPCRIAICFGRYISTVVADVCANKKYQLTHTPGIHWNVQLSISEVDVIDSE